MADILTNDEVNVIEERRRAVGSRLDSIERRRLELVRFGVPTSAAALLANAPEDINVLLSSHRAQAARIEELEAEVETVKDIAKRARRQVVGYD